MGVWHCYSTFTPTLRKGSLVEFITVVGPAPNVLQDSRLLSFGAERPGKATSYTPIGSQIRQDYPLNLSISISGGKETNKDSLSNGE